MIMANENSCGLSAETISKHLKTISYDDRKVRATSAKVDQEPECCIVCLEDLYQKDEATTTLECGHEYHIDCIKLWLQKKNLCPICRDKALPVKDENQDTSSFIVVQINDGVAGQGRADHGGYAHGHDGDGLGHDEILVDICHLILTCTLVASFLGIVFLAYKFLRLDQRH